MAGIRIHKLTVRRQDAEDECGKTQLHSPSKQHLIHISEHSGGPTPCVPFYSKHALDHGCKQCGGRSLPSNVTNCH
jgi:hypothetical protein